MDKELIFLQLLILTNNNNNYKVNNKLDLGITTKNQVYSNSKMIRGLWERFSSKKKIETKLTSLKLIMDLICKTSWILTNQSIQWEPKNLGGSSRMKKKLRSLKQVSPKQVLLTNKSKNLEFSPLK